MEIQFVLTHSGGRVHIANRQRPKTTLCGHDWFDPAPPDRQVRWGLCKRCEAKYVEAVPSRPVLASGWDRGRRLA